MSSSDSSNSFLASVLAGLAWAAAAGQHHKWRWTRQQIRHWAFHRVGRGTQSPQTRTTCTPWWHSVAGSQPSTLHFNFCLKTWQAHFFHFKNKQTKKPSTKLSRMDNQFVHQLLFQVQMTHVAGLIPSHMCLSITSQHITVMLYGYFAFNHQEYERHYHYCLFFRQGLSFYVWLSWLKNILSRLYNIICAKIHSTL